MAWFAIDDGFADHPKVIRCSLAALGLWTKAGAWCAKHLTDGRLPASMVKAWGGSPKLAAELVAAGLWVLDGDAYQFHDWSARNPLRADVERKRASDAKRKRDERAAAAESEQRPRGRPSGHPSGQTQGHPRDCAPDSSASPRARARDPLPSPPIPSHPIPEEDPPDPPSGEDEPEDGRPLRLSLLSKAYEDRFHASFPTVTPWERVHFFGPVLDALEARHPGDEYAQVVRFDALLARWAADLARRGHKPSPAWLLRDFAKWIDAEAPSEPRYRELPAPPPEVIG